MLVKCEKCVNCERITKKDEIICTAEQKRTNIERPKYCKFYTKKR